MADKVRIPEVLEPDSQLPPDLVALRRFAYLLDEAIPIPGTRRRVGLDAGLGLIPGVGDMVGGLLSAWIVVGALRHRVPMRVIFRMLFNIIIDLAIGAVPLLGDVFDFFFEENMMNMALLMRYRDRTRPPLSFSQIAGRAFVLVSFIVLVALGFLFVSFTLIVWTINWMMHTR